MNIPTILTQLAKEEIQKIMNSRTELLHAFMAKHGCSPDEVEQVEQRMDDGTVRYRIALKSEANGGPVSYRARYHVSEARRIIDVSKTWMGQDYQHSALPVPSKLEALEHLEKALDLMTSPASLDPPKEAAEPQVSVEDVMDVVEKWIEHDTDGVVDTSISDWSEYHVHQNGFAFWKDLRARLSKLFPSHT